MPTKFEMKTKDKRELCVCVCRTQRQAGAHVAELPAWAERAGKFA